MNNYNILHILIFSMFIAPLAPAWGGAASDWIAHFFGANSSSKTNCEPKKWDRTYSKKFEMKKPMEVQSALLVTHAVPGFDTSLSIKTNLNVRIAQAVREKSTVIYLNAEFDKDYRLKKYFFEYQPDYIYDSNRGAHQIPIRAREVKIAGGYFSHCAGETARDAIIFCRPKSESEKFRLTYLADSIYIEDPKKDYHHGMPPTITLQKRLSIFNDEQMLAYLRINYFTYERVGLQKTEYREANFNDYTFEILRNGKWIGRFGKGPTKIEMNFVL